MATQAPKLIHLMPPEQLTQGDDDRVGFRFEPECSYRFVDELFGKIQRSPHESIVCRKAYDGTEIYALFFMLLASQPGAPRPRRERWFRLVFPNHRP